MPAEGQRFQLLSTEVSHHEDRYVVAPRGELDLSTVGALEAEIRAAEASDAKRIVIDLSGLTFMDSTGLHLLLLAYARSRENSNRLRLVRGTDRVQSVFRMTDTERILPFLD